MKMRKRSILFISLALLLVFTIGGATMAWFTDKATPITNKFKAGTVKITLNDVFDETKATNVNPGDWYEKKVSVTSNGTKQTYVRVKLTPECIAADGRTILPINNMIMTLNTTDWVYDNDGWYYYKKILNKDAVTSLLLSGVTFNESLTDNTYQGATFTIKVEAEAVQASHYAFRAEWNKGSAALVPATGVEAWIPQNEAPTN